MKVDAPQFRYRHSFPVWHLPETLDKSIMRMLSGGIQIGKIHKVDEMVNEHEIEPKKNSFDITGCTTTMLEEVTNGNGQ